MQTTHDLLVGTLSIGIPSIIGIAQKTFICQIICIPSSTFKISTKMNFWQNFVSRKLTSQGLHGLYKSLML